MRRRTVSQALHKVTVRVNHAHASPVPYVLKGKEFEQVRLTRPGTPDHIDMGKTVRLLDAEHSMRRTTVRAAEVRNIRIHVLSVRGRRLRARQESVPGRHVL